MCSPVFSMAPGYGRESLGFEAIFCFSCKRILSGHVPIVAARYGSIVAAVSIVNATCLLKVKFSS